MNEQSEKSVSVPNPIRVLIADDHEIFRLGLEAALLRSKKYVIVGEATNGQELIELAKNKAFDLVIADHKMPEISGLEALISIKSRNQKTKAVLLTVVEDPRLRELAENGKIDGYLIKSDNADNVLVGVESVLEGKPVYPDDLVDDSLNKETNPFIQFTRQELQIVRCLARGMTYKDTAAELGIQPKTVESHRSNMSHKVGKMSIADLTRLALRWGIIDQKELK